MTLATYLVPRYPDSWEKVQPKKHSYDNLFMIGWPAMISLSHSTAFKCSDRVTHMYITRLFHPQLVQRLIMQMLTQMGYIISPTSLTPSSRCSILIRAPINSLGLIAFPFHDSLQFVLNSNPALPFL